ncbi:Asparagine synthetase [glutamine-hydrolyzing] 1 [Afipia felis]|uniref:asparagine synthase (glutamine-hydrolyzing) n=1 Tax=Afipia felis TaxID=1035 RepID=A0A090MQG5_AFIFE|nr:MULTISPECIES: asparagine synthase (glutamine-hydrolyzing) [Afipia]EFI50937.1 asparagine synthase (glutamine-hydrolyzing) [Afipia sp. 1NLS2]MBE0702389.1 asparagine synthase (glutamine-hydrolyzing) [Afipia sp.]CEG09611.1 Asparagine synthetase [glutamine-hydrolyzing] 1 [Afipia felis]
MCGIAGIFLHPEKSDPRKLATIAQLTATLQHRGPDASGTWIDVEGGIALGHRRLSIVDLSEAGKQPMLSRDKNLVMSFNGEVYNFAELRRTLEKSHHRFRGHSDSEVMLATFESFGIEASLPQFSGMFALGVWDRRARTLHLMRDRMGKKPLYIAIVPDGIVFASELKAIRAYPGFEPRIDRNAIAMVLQYGFIPDHSCIWEGVFKLPPGSILSITADDVATGSLPHLRRQVRRWWQLAATAEAGQRNLLTENPADLETELDQLLRDAVQQRMKADVPFGVFLSGGIDSSMIAALMQAQSQQPIRSFTIGFAESSYDEAHHAAMVARHFGMEHTEFRVTPDEALAVIPDIPQVWDEPFADESQIPTLLLSRLARQHVTVALSGDGGDECFGGYSRHIAMARLGLLFKMPARLRHMMASAFHMRSPEAWEKWFGSLPLSEDMRALLIKDNLDKLARVLNVTNDGELYHRLMSFSRGSQTASFGLLEHEDIPDLSDAASHIMYCDMASYLVGDILVKLDRATMAASLEARSPFLDHRVVEFAWRLPTALKVRNGQGKWILRQVLRRYLPEYLFERPKQGFNVPIGFWLRGPLREWAQGLLDMRRIRDDGLIDSRSVQACWQEHLTGQRDRSRYLWSVLMVQSWLDANRHTSPSLPVLDPPAVKCHVEAES